MSTVLVDPVTRGYRKRGEEAAFGGWRRGDTSCMKAPLAVKGHLRLILAFDFREWDTLQASRTEDRAPRGRDLSAEPEAGIRELRPQGRLAPEISWHKSDKSWGPGRSPGVVKRVSPPVLFRLTRSY